MTNSERTIVRLQMRKAVAALMEADAGLRPYRYAIVAPKAWGWPRADYCRGMVRFPDGE